MTQLFRDILTWAPPWMRTGNTETLLGAIGAELDARAEQYLVARLQAVPYAGGARLADGRLMQCEPVALPAHARDRGITLYPTEGEISQRTRLSIWRQLHQQRGTHRGELNHVRPYFADAAARGLAYPTLRIVHTSGGGITSWHTMSPDGVYSLHGNGAGNWNWDGQPSKWSRWWAIVYLPVGYSSGFNYDGATDWDSSGIWDGVPSANLADIYALFADWKSAHSRLSGLIVTALQPTDTVPGGTGHPFDPAGTAETIGSYTTLPTGNWGAVVYASGPNIGLPTRPPWALFYNIDNG